MERHRSSLRPPSDPPTRRASLFSSGCTPSIHIDPATNVGWTILKRDLVLFALPEEVDDFAVDQSDVLQIQCDSRHVALGRDQGLQFRQTFDSHSTDEGQHHFRVRAPQNLEHETDRANEWPP